MNSRIEQCRAGLWFIANSIPILCIILISLVLYPSASWAALNKQWPIFWEELFG